MDGTESLGTILIRIIIQIVISVIALCILYFAAYKPIKRIMNRYMQQNNNKLGILDKQNIEVMQKSKDISEVTDRTIGKFEYEKDKIKDKAKRAMEEEGKILESIITKNQKIIGKEREKAIEKIRREYEHLIIDYNKSDDTLNKKYDYTEKQNKNSRGKITDK